MESVFTPDGPRPDKTLVDPKKRLTETNSEESEPPDDKPQADVSDVSRCPYCERPNA